MVTISLCMIVKNEEDKLARCMDSLRGLMDEIIIVDTGSTDSTKEIAARYTDKIYDFEWVDDFSAARNFAFSKASMEYIYSADADEVLLAEHRGDFEILKQTLLPEIEIVQMKYGNQLEKGSVYNYDLEYRPKLYKRLRDFTWEDPIHEAVRLFPIVYDSDVIITHMPDEEHGGRDLQYFRRATEGGGSLSKRLHHMYASELLMSGTDEDILMAREYFEGICRIWDPAADGDIMAESLVIVAKACSVADDIKGLMKYSARLIAGAGCSEIGMILGEYYERSGDPDEAYVWYTAALYGTEPILVRSAGDEDPKEALRRIGRG